MVRTCSFFGQGTPSRSRVHEPVIGSESFGNQEGNSSYDTRDVGKSAASNWFELARHPTSELGRKPHMHHVLIIITPLRIKLNYNYFSVTALKPTLRLSLVRDNNLTNV